MVSDTMGIHYRSSVGMICFGVIRFVIDRFQFQHNQNAIWLNMSLAQLLSLVIIIIGTSGLVLIKCNSTQFSGLSSNGDSL